MSLRFLRFAPSPHMRVRTLWPSAVLAVLSLPLVQGSPPISSSIVSNWLAPSFLVQYL